ncbi:helix-turn-helix transcriptional regulator [Robiginitalea sp.]|uniref:helix-turn-helix transcriptional regulator n=1 Tax=Robiginitalea sp. TaxID=1902411 RepID=UPI003C7900AE
MGTQSSQLHFMTNGYLPELLRGLQADGVHVDKLLKYPFLKNLRLYDPDCLIPCEISNDILARIQEVTGCKSLVGEMPHYFRSTNMGSASRQIYQQGNFLSFLTTTVCLQNRIRTNYEIKLVTTGVTTRFSVEVKEAQSIGKSITEEIDIARIIDGFRCVLGTDFQPLELNTTAREIKNIEHLLPKGNYTVRTGQKESSIVFHSSWLSKRIPNLLEGGQKEDEDAIPELTSSRIELLMDNMQDGFVPNLAQIALMAGLSRRTIERRLKSEYTTFRQLKQRYLERKSYELLMDPDFSVRMVAEFLNFANPQNFIRSFRTWNGLSPSEYRNKL